MKRLLPLLFALIFAWALPLPAHANGRPPTALSVSIKRSDPSHLIVGASFGALITRNGGKSWQWLCESAVEMADADPEWLWLEDDTLLAVTFAAPYRRSKDGGCTWPAPEPPGGGFVVDLEPHPAALNRMLSVVRLETGAEPVSRVFRSENGGETLDSKLLEVTGERLSAVRFAPSAPEHIYAAALASSTQTSTLYHSRDSGLTWERHVFRTGAGFEFVLAGVHPTDPNVVFAITYGHNALLRSEDGGRSFQEVLATGAYLLAFHVDSRSGLIWASDGVSGLYRSDDGGKSFARLLGAPSANCIASDQNGVYVCANALKDGFVVGRSVDNEHFSAFMPWFSVLSGPLECPAGTEPHDSLRCAPAWPALAASVGANPMTTAGTAGASGAPSENAPAATGCGCGVSKSQSAGVLGFCLLLGTLLGLRRFRAN